MRKLIYILILVFLSFTFNPMPPPGWYQQTLPVNDFINDIFFIDSLNGWAVTSGSVSVNDTAYILRTTNGGDNWIIQHTREENLSSIQFLDQNTGYTAGGTGNGLDRFYKTTDGGNNWIQLGLVGLTLIEDLFFINKDTGWVCDDSYILGGLYKTTDGGNSWVQQLGSNYRTRRVFLLNKDTGWVGTDDINGKFYRTTNGGINWNIQYTFPGNINDIHFLNNYVGIVTSGRNQRTTDGGFTWTESNDGGMKLSMGTDSVGWAGNNLIQIQKTTNQGITWGRQTTNVSNPSVSAFDSLITWAGGSGIVHTTDGGGPMTYIKQVSKGIPDKFILQQNYPNPFNPKTIIKFNCKKTSDVSLKVYDLSGKLIDGIFYENVHTGEYQYEFDGTGLTSGVYFYSLVVDGNVVDTKKMVLIK